MDNYQMPVKEPQILLNDCREFMTSRLRSSMSRMMENLENILFELAAQNDNESKGDFYIDAVRELRLKKREIQVRFENRLSTTYFEILRQLFSSTESNLSDEINSQGHSVENIYNYSEISILTEPVENTRQECRSALLVLDNNINSLLDNLDADEIINPMQPEIIYNAFWDSCDDLRCGTEVRVIMLQMFERQVAMDLVTIYDDINVLLNYFLHESDSILARQSKTAINDEQLDGDSYRDSSLVKCWAQSHIMERVGSGELPELVETFLMEHWSELLAVTFQKYSIESLEWERAILVVDHLVECSTLTHDKQSRLNQIWQFPGLIYRLKSGMKTISLPLSIQAKFISELKVFHSQLTEQNLKNINN